MTFKEIREKVASGYYDSNVFVPAPKPRLRGKIDEKRESERTKAALKQRHDQNRLTGELWFDVASAVFEGLGVEPSHEKASLVMEAFLGADGRDATINRAEKFTDAVKFLQNEQAMTLRGAEKFISDVAGFTREPWEDMFAGLKHEKAICLIFRDFLLKHIEPCDKSEVVDYILRTTEHTPKSLNDNLEKGVGLGYPVETQLQALASLIESVDLTSKFRQPAGGPDR